MPVRAGLGSFRCSCGCRRAANDVPHLHSPDGHATMLSRQTLYGLVIPRAASSAPLPASPSLNILVVEDDPTVGMLLMEMLLSMGHTVCAVRTSPADAVSAAARYEPDLMLVDARLGRGSGVAAVVEIRRRQDIPFIYMSGAPIAGRQPDDIVLRKPFIEKDIVLAILGAMARHRPRRGNGHQ